MDTPFNDSPFKCAVYGDIQSFAVTVEDRCDMVRKFSRAQCEAALRLDGLQRTVERAIQSRLRRLDREEGAA